MKYSKIDHTPYIMNKIWHVRLSFALQSTRDIIPYNIFMKAEFHQTNTTLIRRYVGLFIF